MVGGSLAPDAHTVAHEISMATGRGNQFTHRHALQAGTKKAPSREGAAWGQAVTSRFARQTGAMEYLPNGKICSPPS